MYELKIVFVEITTGHSKRRPLEALMTEPKHSGQSEAVQLYNGMVGTGNSTILYKVLRPKQMSASRETNKRVPTALITSQVYFR